MPVADGMKFVLVLVRVATMLAFVPFLGGKVVPGIIKTLTAVALAFTLYPFAAAVPAVHRWEQPLRVGLLIFSEVCFGAVMGFSARLIFKALRSAGEIIGHQMGMALARASDPVTGVETTVVANFCEALGVLVFFSVGGHRMFIRAIHKSLQEWPVGQLLSADFVREITVTAAAKSFTIAFQFAAPLVVAMFSVALIMAILARLVPEINVLIVGFPLRVGGGLVGFTLLLPRLIRSAGDLCRMMGRFYQAYPK